jgi:hypothetical protein
MTLDLLPKVGLETKVLKTVFMKHSSLRNMSHQDIERTGTFISADLLRE